MRGFVLGSALGISGTFCAMKTHENNRKAQQMLDDLHVFQRIERLSTSDVLPSTTVPWKELGPAAVRLSYWTDTYLDRWSSKMTWADRLFSGGPEVVSGPAYQVHFCKYLDEKVREDARTYVPPPPGPGPQWF
jgi:hypothetical protein